MNSKNYRDIILEYVQKLGEVDTTEDKLFELKKSGKLEEANKIEKQLNELKKEANGLKQQIENCKRKNK